MRTVQPSKGGYKFVWLKMRPSLSTQKQHAGRQPVSPGGQASVSSLSPVVGTQAQGPDSPGITVCPPHVGETRGGCFPALWGSSQASPHQTQRLVNVRTLPVTVCGGCHGLCSLRSTGRARRHQSARPNLPTSWPQEPDLREQSSSQRNAHLSISDLEHRLVTSGAFSLALWLAPGVKRRAMRPLCLLRRAEPCGATARA